jgi:BirA family biotin operon repressor/biotin-[acetyl-CoA-carboxylase] ligase
LIAYDFPASLFNIKWPNDVLIDGQKLSGVLIELSGEASCSIEAIIGIGMNVNMRDANLDNSWTSLCKYTPRSIDRNLLTAYLIDEVLCTVSQFERHGFGFFLEQWQRFDVLKNQYVQLKFQNSVIEGLCQGIDDKGNILLKHKDDTLKSYCAGEVSTQLKG